MNNLFLCGHTGSKNRGCEAIVKSTLGLFEAAGLKQTAYLATFNPSEDKEANLHKSLELIPYSSYNSKFQRAFSAVRRKLGNPLAGQDIIQKNLWNKIHRSDLSLVIGGDTYCYGRPTVFMAHNAKMKKENIPTVLWCCSIEKDKLSGEILRDIKNYDLIVARETTTEKNLLQAGIEKEKILLSCDPAFTLTEEQTPLPQDFAEGNTVGINLSPMVMNPTVFSACEYLIDSILRDTDMGICLIPHVYSLDPDTQDAEILRKFFEKYKSTGRVSFPDKSYTCSQLKYIIGKTRFFIGARTHSTIAAYSSKVPTLVLGYSVKSIGIARDLFGKSEGYVLPYDKIQNKEDIYEAFKGIINKENEIKAHYEKVLPTYTASVKEATNTLIKRYLKT